MSHLLSQPEDALFILLVLQKHHVDGTIRGKLENTTLSVSTTKTLWC